MNINEKFTDDVLKNIREEIELVNGNEVFFRGILDENKKISKIEALARGNKKSAPALIKRMKKEEVIIHNHPSGYLYPSDADIEVASYYANNFNGGFYIVNNSVTDVYVVTEVHNEKLVSIDVIPYFEKNGIISQVFSEFEYRKEQQEMADIIQKGFNEEKKVVVEAGTGTGKTLAYLIPGIEWAVKNKKRIVFSTNTINLQEQLLNKDIPLAKKVLGYDFKHMLVKGRGNYLCNRKFYNYLYGEKIDIDDLSTMHKNQLNEIMKWGSKTETGDRAELTFEVDSQIWENFQSETDICAGNRCPYKNECFFYKVRDEKKKADVLITNHHLYFTDLAIRKEIGFNTEYSILPEYSAMVFDEAHNVEKVARDYFSAEISKLSFIKLLNKIMHTDIKKKNKGSLINSEIICKKINNNDGISLIGNLKEKHVLLVSEVRKYFNEIINLVTREGQETVSIRLKKNYAPHINYIDYLTNITREFLVIYSDYQRISKSLIRILKEIEDESGDINELIKYLERVEEQIGNLKFINTMDDDDYIYWLEVNRRKGFAKRVATPLKIDSELEKNLFINLKTIIFTSATIAVGKSFKYFKESVGIKEETFEKVIYSPFEYNKQMKVYIPNNFQDPNSKDFIMETSEFLKKLLIASKGRCFVLFTSYSSLNFVYYSVRDELLKSGIELFIHGTLPRTQLVEMYKISNNPVLFGTDSFWEGVDIKGEKLSNVVIIKLPFKVPNDPITEAIIENITLKGKNSFTEYQIPEAVIKFKQGIGRLIRSKSDKGRIIILDNRIVKKQYGEFFREAIPTNNVVISSKDRIINEISINMEEI